MNEKANFSHSPLRCIRLVHMEPFREANLATEPTDESGEFAALVAGLKAGDPTAAREIYQRFEPFLRASVRRQLHPQLRSRFDSLDFVQDVWASFLAIPSDRYSFENPQSLLAFLHRVAYNKVVAVFRHRFESEKSSIQRERPLDANELSGDAIRSHAPTPSQWLIADEEWDRLMKQFPPGHRVILMRLREGYTYEDISRMGNVSVSTVDRIVRRLKSLTGL